MKFRTKLTISIMLLLCLCLNINGYLMISHNFEELLNTTAAQNTIRHQTDAGYIEKTTAQLIAQQYAQWEQKQASHAAEAFPAQGVTGYAVQQACVTLTEQKEPQAEGFGVRETDGTPVYTRMPDGVSVAAQLEAAAMPSDAYRLVRSEQGSYMLMTTPLLISGQALVLSSAYDITAVFDARTGQLQSLLLFTLISLFIGGVLALLLSGLLTRPVEKLKAASDRIASGDYSQRTCLGSDDEFGSLSRSFDTMAQAVEEHIEALETNVRKQEDFVAAFTHEIKTPMASMLGYSSLLCAGMEDAEQQQAAHDYIWRETRRLEDLSQKLLMLLGLKEEGIRLQPVSAHALIEGVLRTLPDTEKEVCIETELCAELFVSGDAVLLDDMLRNLLINAVHACPDVGGKITVGCVRQNGQAALYVSDNGCGIPPQELERITEPFYMVDKSRARKNNGSGLGLTLASRIAELHGSRLHFQSEPGQGTRVSVLLDTIKEGAL